VHGRPEYVGATFMHLDRGIDTGKIIHQIRARIYPGDTVHLIGNRLIADAAEVFARLVANFHEVIELPQPSDQDLHQLCLRRDFTRESIHQLRSQFESGMIARYLGERERRCRDVPLVQQPWLVSESDRL
jgi:methionyl-tRNA formyltransferase